MFKYIATPVFLFPNKNMKKWGGGVTALCSVFECYNRILNTKRFMGIIDKGLK